MFKSVYPWRLVLSLAIVLLGLVLNPSLTPAGEDKGGVKAMEGRPSPDFSLEGLDGKPFKLSENKGKVVVVDLWATWCGPCVKSLPDLQKLSEDKSLASRGLVVVAPNVGEDKPTIKEFIEKNKYTLTVLVDEKTTLANALGVSGIPTKLVIGRDGIIRKVLVGNVPAVGDQPSSEDQLKQAIEAALNEKA
jgi:peroxiredoxin